MLRRAKQDPHLASATVEGQFVGAGLIGYAERLCRSRGLTVQHRTEVQLGLQTVSAGHQDDSVPFSAGEAPEGGEAMPGIKSQGLPVGGGDRKALIRRRPGQVIRDKRLLWYHVLLQTDQQMSLEGLPADIIDHRYGEMGNFFNVHNYLLHRKNSAAAFPYLLDQDLPHHLRISGLFLYKRGIDRGATAVYIFDGEAETLGGLGEGDGDVYLPAVLALFQLPQKIGIQIPVENRSRRNLHPVLGEDPCALGPVDPQADQGVIAVKKTETIAIGDHFVCLDLQKMGMNLPDTADLPAHRFGGIE